MTFMGSVRVRLRSSGIIILGVLTILLAACSEPPYNNINNGELQVLLEQGYTLIDIRRPDEWRQTGVVEGSRLMTFVDGGGRVTPGFLDKLQTEYSADTPLILICRTGNRTSTLATYMVEKLGFTQVYNVRNGITDWIREDRPVVRQF